MYCVNCGTQNDPAARFCSGCGASLVAQRSPDKRPSRRGCSCGWLTLLVGVPLLCLVVAVCGTGGLFLAYPDLFDLEIPVVLSDPDPAPAPATTGEAIEQVVGPSGLEFGCPGGATMNVPAGALAQDTTIQVSQLLVTPGFPPEYLSSPAGPAYEVIIPEDSELRQPVELVLPLEVQEGVDPSLYTVFTWDGASWWDVGGIVEGDVIRVQLTHFSVFQPALGYTERRPVGFVNHGPYNATVRPWTYVPASSNTPAPAPTASTASFAPTTSGLWPNSSRFLSLPLGTYTWCMDWTTGRDDNDDQYVDYFHRVDSRTVTLDANAPTEHDSAVQVDFNTESGRRGRCGTPPTVTAAASAAGADHRATWSNLPLRPVGFVNHGSYNATVRAWTYVPAGESEPVPAPSASTASFAPTTSGLWPNSSRFLSLPLGTYTWCMDWTDGRDEDEDQYFDYYHWVDTREVVLDENDPTELDSAAQVDFNTERSSPGRCGPGPYGVASGASAGEGGSAIVPGAGQVTIRLTWSTTDDLDLHVVDPNNEEIYYGNRTSSTGGTLDVDANAACGEVMPSPVENVFWSDRSAPRGTYQVTVRSYADCDEVPTVSFRLRILVSGSVVYDATETLDGRGDRFTYSFTR